MSGRNEPYVVGVCGSVRDGSRTRVALKEALDAAASAGGTVGLVDLQTCELPGPGAVESAVADAPDLRETLGRADSVLLATPNYHGSYSGAMKYALDACGREEFEGTTVGLLEVAAGDFPGSALRHLRTVSRTLRAWTLPTEVAIPDSHSVVADGGIGDPDLAARTRRLGRDLVEYAGVATYPETVERRSVASADPEADHRSSTPCPDSS